MSKYSELFKNPRWQKKRLEITKKVQAQTQQSKHSSRDERRPCVHGTMCLVYSDDSINWRDCPECCDSVREKRAAKEAVNRKKSLYDGTMSAFSMGVYVPKRFVGKSLDNYRVVNNQQKTIISVCKKYIDSGDKKD